MTLHPDLAPPTGTPAEPAIAVDFDRAADVSGSAFGVTPEVLILNAREPSPHGAHRAPVPVFAHVEWETGTEVMQLAAVQYDIAAQTVKVVLPDPRCSARSVWLGMGDIRIDDGQAAPPRTWIGS
ncbi:hypothetical protein [Brevibacterium sp.]|uniref:hypothetical protein n=1 Tax=Brevibacterium sp. TaxID=1701 RepID=UPI0025BF93BC|nr:hypothetical protein [Brevibacterium sp.]